MRMRDRFAMVSVCIIMVLYAPAGSALADPGIPCDGPLTGRSVESFLTPDGAFDLEAARRMGFEGPVRLDGFEAQIDPRTGRPIVTALGRSPSRLAGDEWWWDGFGSPSTLPGVDLHVLCMAVYQQELIVGGCFTEAGGVPANRIARWDGSRWHPLGRGFSNWVLALTVYEGELVAGLVGTREGRSHGQNRIARWNGTEWRAFGEEPNDGMDGDVSALTVYDGDLIAGGWFNNAGGTIAPHIACWDGSRWIALDKGMDGNVYALEVYDGMLIAGGSFTSAGSAKASRIARWDGTQWSPLEAGIRSTAGFAPQTEVRTLTVYNGLLVAGGWFNRAGDEDALNIAAWDGSRWSSISSGLNNWVRALTVHDGRLIATGWFTSAGRISARHVAAWDGTSWRSVGQGTSDWVYDAVTIWNGNLIAGGWFLRAGEVDAGHISAWNGSEWLTLEQLPPGKGLNGVIHALAVHKGDLIAGGEFSVADGVQASNIARWDGENWSPLGAGFNAPVFALSADGDLVAGGGFTYSGGLRTDHIAFWNGDWWEPIGAGFDGAVRALAPYDGMVAGGEFRYAGETRVGQIARWDGAKWNPLGEGTNRAVEALAVHDEDLYAGGQFNEAGGNPAPFIARWDGADWHPVADGMDGHVKAMITYQGDLIATGAFRHAGGSAASGIARFDGDSWNALTPEAVLYVGTSLAVYQGSLIVGGRFEWGGPLDGHFIARWDGEAWHPLGSGTDDLVNSLAVVGDDLYAGGDFRLAGGNASYHIARWSTPPPEVPEDPAEDEIEPPSSDPPPPQSDPLPLSTRLRLPNPYRSGQSLLLELPKNAAVELGLFDVSGRRLGAIFDGFLSAGRHEIHWDGRVGAAGRLAPGVYYVRAQLGDRREARTIVLRW